MRRCLIPLLLFSLFFTGCHRQTDSVTDYDSLMYHLERSDISVEIIPKDDNSSGDLLSRLFSGEVNHIRSNEDIIAVLEYKNETDAVREAAFVGHDGFDISMYPNNETNRPGAHVDWTAPPYWFQTGRIIVLYVGRDNDIISFLRSVLGDHYAGYGIGPPEVTDFASFIENMLISGTVYREADVEGFPGDSEGIFTGTVKELILRKEEEHISVLAYDDEGQAEKEAHYISSDGCTYTKETMIVNISWAATPHFYRAARIIVLYIGDTPEIIDKLEDLLGPQFAGY